MADRSNSAHYTPGEIATLLVVMGPTSPARTLDPACGDGALLCAVLEAWSPTSAAEALELAARWLRGVELDPDAAGRARARLAALVESMRAPGELTPDMRALDAVVTSGDALELIDERFERVVANPPFGRDGEGRELFDVFARRCTGEWLEPGGSVSLLVPDAILARSEHGALRGALTHASTMRSACHVGRVFPGVGVSAVVLHFEARTPRAEDTVHVLPWPAGARAAHSIPHASLSKGGWPIAAPPGWLGPSGLLQRIESSPGTLEDVLEPGVRGATRGEELGARATLGSAVDGETTPIHAGRDVGRGRLDAPSRHVPVASVKKQDAVHRGPKVLVVKTGSTPVAAVCGDHTPTLQSCYMLRPRAGLSHEALSALLDSAIVGAYCHARWTSAKLLQPQLTLRNLRDIPIPEAGELQRANAWLESFYDALAREDHGAIEEYDARVAELYGLEWDEISDAIADSLAHLPASQRPRWVDEPPDLGLELAAPEVVRDDEADAH